MKKFLEKLNKINTEQIQNYGTILTSIIIFIVGLIWAIKTFFFCSNFPTRDDVINFSILMFVLNGIISGLNAANMLKIFRGIDPNNTKVLTKSTKKK